MEDKYSHAYYDWVQQHLYSAVLADIMDSLDYRDQIMDAHIQPLYPGAVLVGRAATMLATETFTVPQKPYSMELELLDELHPGEVVVCGMSGHRAAALWGELLSTHTRAKGGRGALIEGACRDSRNIIAMQFPVFCTCLIPADSKGRYNVVEIRTQIKVGSVLVNNNDLILADGDGCVVIPQSIEDEVIRKAMEKVSGENKVREILRKGASIRQVFEEYGIL